MAHQIYLDGILYFVVLFDISKDGGCPYIETTFVCLVVVSDIRIDDIKIKKVNVIHILFVPLNATKNGSKHKLVYLVS